MVCALYGELDGQELAVEALRRIVQAELMGQFYKLKYFAGDLQREIRYPVSEMQESLWKKKIFRWREVHFGQKRWMIFTTLCGLVNFLIVPACLTVLEARGSAC